MVKLQLIGYVFDGTLNEVSDSKRVRSNAVEDCYEACDTVDFSPC